MYKLLVVDDDVEMTGLLTEYLAPEGFDIDVSHLADSGLQQALSGEYDLVVLDVTLPDGNGFDVLARLRGSSQVPVLMLTGRAEDVDRIVGLEMGADDYLPKPFNPRELLARMRTILRRTRVVQNTPQRQRRLAAGDICLDRGTRTVTRGESVLSLTFAEFCMLELLLDATGETVLREEISVKALGRELAPYDRSIDVHMSNLRKKLGPSTDGSERIVTVRGTGYFYNMPDGLVESSMLGNAHPAVSKEM